MIALLALAAMTIQPSASSEALVSHALAAWRREPETRIEDAYKWLYHATHGGEHALAVEDGPRSWFESEWQSVGPPLPQEPTTVALDPEGRILRVNLRPAKAAALDAEMVFQIFLRSAEAFTSDPTALREAWSMLGDRLRKAAASPHLNHKEWRRLDADLARRGFRARHHSEAYARAAKPAYRVVLGALWTR